MSETITPTIVEQEQPALDHHARVRATLGKLSLDQAPDIIASFHEADTHTLGRRADMPDKINSIVSKTNEYGRQSPEIIAQGVSVEEALYNTWLGMRELETVKTKPLMRMEIGRGADVDFTKLEHYAPKVAPDIEAYTVPEHIAPYLEGNTKGRHTYDKTTAIEGWDKQILGQVERFTQTERGAELIKDLKIKSLATLTPEQAVKFTLSMVHDLSKYTYDENGEPNGDREDELTTMELLEEGFSRKDDPNWSGNGVCRNIASNVKAIFESLKLNQTEVSMLHNTYVGYTGSNESFRIGERENAGTSSELGKPGHAWNTISTIDTTGSASITIIDVTWSLQKTPQEALEHMDYTQMRMTGMARELFDKSDDKTKSFPELNEYYKIFMHDSMRKYHTFDERAKIKGFATTEYLRAAEKLFSEVKDRRWLEQEVPPVPSEVVSGAAHLRDNLAKSELETLFKLDKAGAIDTFDGILSLYVSGTENIANTAMQNKARSLAVADNELQQNIFDKLSREKIHEFAEASPDFRIRTREFAPDTLPTFDPETNPADMEELVELAGRNRLNAGRSLKGIETAVTRGLLEVTNGNRELVTQATQSHDLYDLVKNYKQITEQLSVVT
jgi:hypothetical protein